MADISFTGVFETGFERIESVACLQEGVDSLVSLDLLDEDFNRLKERAGRLAVEISAETHYRTLEPYAKHLALIMISFSHFGDGRGFSLANRLRRNLDFRGEIRASGHILPDQAHYLMRVGFDSATVPDARKEAFEQAKDRFSHFYQNAYRGGAIAHQRHKSSGEGQAA